MSSATTSNVKVWVSGAWPRRLQMGVLIDHLRRLGYEITHDWTQVEKAEHPTFEDQGDYARFDIDGVKASDIAVAVMDDGEYSYRGTYTEIGCALGVGKPLHIVCPVEGDAYIKTNVFFHHPDITHHKSWDDFVEYLVDNYPLN
jgi:nucleoside 2-deoxyribosyltransferase-like protein